ncbi:Ldh family oxidoreductase [Chelatococcus asaccharovorans]|uniref:Ureidoglycolate dehydrogenase (NAD+) n=1 Tax=Chelatococcus asaccharovorans TaxID=28210 RepID=A0A2V3TTX3_9HYPH|nr:Ldh family oxidoreductase [Chelatococcus asaccharovorans]MBS7704972.1 Ldh family oxidoreductase [Chelatococcus asaccharovorans]PXW51886.1 ureidoglycolate dehydrogenase (NAD+) [Chelatococcus asaccharovorans]
MTLAETRSACIDLETLKAFSVSLLAEGGFPSPRAKEVADLLVWANARGMDSHGVLRIPRYIEMVEEGVIVPDAQPEIIHRAGAIAIQESGRAPGATAMCAAMDEAVAIAGTHGIGWCSARNITHAGAIGYYAMRAALAGHVGIVMTASGPLMAYHGAAVASVSTNPLAIAAPVGFGDPIILDMSTSNVALGKIMAARDAGTPVPEGWGIDKDGQATTNAAAVATLLPLGGPKGSGLSLMIEVLASLLCANAIIAPALRGGEAGRMNGIALALNIAAFGSRAGFEEDLRQLASTIRALPSASGVDAILMPGERGFRTEADRALRGIPLARGTCKRLASLADRFGIARPAALRADL